MGAIETWVGLYVAFVVLLGITPVMYHIYKCIYPKGCRAKPWRRISIVIPKNPCIHGLRNPFRSSKPLQDKELPLLETAHYVDL